jgi:hypothetical protein
MALRLPIRVFSSEGTLVLRDGLVFVLFIPASHCEISTQIERVLGRYLALCGQNAPTLICDRGENYRRFSPEEDAALRWRMSRERRGHFMVTLRDGTEPAVPNYRFQYLGEAASRDADCVSHLELWFPTELLDAIGPDVLVGELLAMAAEVPFSSGYCSIALNYDDWVEVPLASVIRGTALRMPGIDVRNSLSVACSIGNRVRGAYWLTLLGPQALAMLKTDAASLQSLLGEHIRIYPVEHGVAIRAGVAPEVGDVNRLQLLPSVRRVAAVIEPVTFLQTHGVTLEEVEDDLRWQRRHYS